MSRRADQDRELFPSKPYRFAFTDGDSGAIHFYTAEAKSSHMVAMMEAMKYIRTKYGPAAKLVTKNINTRKPR